MASVQFLLNNTPVETANSSPFSWAWDTTAFAAGNWYVSAIAIDGAGNKSEPAVVEVLVANKAATCGEAPKVKLVYPTDKAVVCGELGVETAASGPCGVTKVEFFVDDKKIGEATEKPYKTPWKTATLKDGPHLVKAVATDAAKQQGQQTIAVQVNNKQTQCVNPPTVYLTKPADDSYVFGKLAIEAEAAAGGDVASIVEVLFSVDGSSVGKASVSPWKTEWDSDAKAEGPHTLKAIAKDNFDKLGVHQITVNVDRTDPSVSFVSPDSAANVNGDATPVTVAAEAQDNLNLAKVTFWVGGKELGVVKQKPYQVTWSTNGTSSGQVTLKAVATDAAGHTKEATRTVTLDRAPTVFFDAPNAGATLSGKVTVTAKASDDLKLAGSGVVKLDGKDVGAQWQESKSGTSATLTYAWDTPQAAFGDHELTAEVEDDAGHKATASIKVKVDQPLLVTVGLCTSTWQNCNAPNTDPKTEYTGKLYLQADAKDDNADVKEMQLQVDGKAVETLTKAPWQFTWDSAGVKDGAHELAVKVTTTLPETKTPAFGLVVNNCDLDKDGHLVQGGTCGGDDCDDKAPKTYTGAVDMAGNATDENCDGLDGVDVDGDKVASIASGGKDCNDLDKGTNPGAVDTVGDGKDNNCDGPDGVDGDGDGWASAASGGKDCDDAAKAVNPGAVDSASPACAGTSASPMPTISGAGGVGAFVATVVTNGGTPTVLYSQGSGLGLAQLYSGKWKQTNPDKASAVGQHVAVATQDASSLVLAYYDSANYTLKVARSGGVDVWNISTPDNNKLVGYYMSIAFGKGNGAHVSYYDYGSYRLKYAYATGTSATVEFVDPATNVGEYTSIKVDGNDKAHIAYYDAGKKALKYATGNAGKWAIETVDAAGDAGKYASLVLDADGNPHIAYYAASAKDLRYASKVGGKWVLETAFATGSVGKFASLGWVKEGWGPVVAFLDEGQGQTMLGYRGQDGWTAVALDGKVAAGAISLAVKPDKTVVVAYYDPVAQNLKVVAAGCDKMGVAGVDENCDGVDGVDVDGDKVASIPSGGKDCDDANKAAYPCADELAGDATDTNCDGKLAPSCDDCSACSQDSLSGGKCLHAPVSEGAGCDDGDACTVGEVCAKAVCGAGKAKDCNDSNACTADACNAVGGCVNSALNGGCDLDGSACTPDACTAGACKAGVAVSCDDKNPCTVDSCDTKSGKCGNVDKGEGAACDDGDLCTTGDVCGKAVCKGAAVVCGVAGETCVAGVCKAAVPDGMALIPAGKFMMGCVPGDGDCSSSEKPQHEVNLDAYYMDVYEVTVAAYKKCVDAGKCTKPNSSNYCSPSQYGTYGAAGKEEHPVNCVTWIQADAYCKWTDAKGRLPTEAEWEKAARGGLSGKKYPWGDQTPTCTPGQPNTVVWSSGGDGCGKDSTWAVGTGSSKNGYGLYDMAGNVWEWVGDWYQSSYYGGSPASNPQGPASGSSRVIRGGSFGSGSAVGLRASERFGVSPSYAGSGLGFRCTRSLP